MCFLLIFSIFTYFVPLTVKSSTTISQNVIPEDPIKSSGKDTGADARLILKYSFLENNQDLNDNETNAVVQHQSICLISLQEFLEFICGLYEIPVQTNDCPRKNK